jgi:hypothetical protein
MLCCQEFAPILPGLTIALIRCYGPGIFDIVHSKSAQSAHERSASHAVIELSEEGTDRNPDPPPAEDQVSLRIRVGVGDFAIDSAR